LGRGRRGGAGSRAPGGRSLGRGGGGRRRGGRRRYRRSPGPRGRRDGGDGAGSGRLGRKLRALLDRQRRQDRVGPLLELLLVVQQIVDVVRRVLELGAPEEGVERTHLHADPAVHAERVVDVEAIEDLHRPGLSAGGRRVGLLVGLDVDAPVGTLARALVADRAVLLLQRDDPTSPRREVGPDLRILLRDRGTQHVLERDPETLDQAEAGRGRLPLRPAYVPLADRHAHPPRYPTATFTKPTTRIWSSASGISASQEKRWS